MKTLFSTIVRGYECHIEIYDIDEYSGNENIQVVLKVRNDDIGFDYEGTIESAYSDFLENGIDKAASIIIIQWYEERMDLIDAEVHSMCS